MKAALLRAALTIAVGAALVPVQPALVVRRGEQVVLVLPLRDQERVGLRFIHSIDGLPVEDWYVIRDGAVVQVETRLLNFGAGMGQIPGVGRAVEDGQWLRVTDMNRTIGTLYLRVGPPSVGHALLYRGETISLSSRWAGESLSLRGGRIPRALVWLSAFQEPWARTWPVNSPDIDDLIRGAGGVGP